METICPQSHKLNSAQGHKAGRQADRKGGAEGEREKDLLGQRMRYFFPACVCVCVRPFDCKDLRHNNLWNDEMISCVFTRRDETRRGGRRQEEAWRGKMAAW